MQYRIKLGATANDFIENVKRIPEDETSVLINLRMVTEDLPVNPTDHYRIGMTMLSKRVNSISLLLRHLTDQALQLQNIKSILTALPKTVTTLDLSNNELNNWPADQLIQIIKDLPPQITSINLEANFLGSRHSFSGKKYSKNELVNLFQSMPADLKDINLYLNHLFESEPNKDDIAVVEALPNNVKITCFEKDNIMSKSELLKKVRGPGFDYSFFLQCLTSVGAVAIGSALLITAMVTSSIAIAIIGAVLLVTGCILGGIYTHGLFSSKPSAKLTSSNPIHRANPEEPVPNAPNI